jgi:hypothetical protein
VQSANNLIRKDGTFPPEVGECEKPLIDYKKKEKTMNENLYQKLCEDTDFLAKAKACKDAAELKALAAERGLEGTVEEAESAFEKLARGAEGELQKAELDSVAGGKKC